MGLRLTARGRVLALMTVMALLVGSCSDDSGEPDATVLGSTLTQPPTTLSSPPATGAVTTTAPTATVAPTTVAPTTVAPTTVAPTTVAPTTVAPTTTVASAPFGGGLDPVSGEAVGFGLLTDVRIAQQTGFDRIVFEFRDGRPGYQIGYTDPPFTNIPGSIVGVAGRAFLSVVLMPTTGVDWEASGDTLVLSYDGPRRIGPAGAFTVTEALFVTDFESVVDWLVGLAEETPFRVSELEDPYRLVIDVGHGTFAADDVPAQYVSGQGTGFGWMTDARLAGSDDFDRFVVEFSPDHSSAIGAAGIPRYDVHNVSGPFAGCTPGGPVAVGGSEFVLVELNPAGAVDLGTSPPVVFWDGPDRLTADDTVRVIEAVMTNDCNGIQWVIGVDEATEFTVSTLSNPPRLVVDIEH